MPTDDDMGRFFECCQDLLNENKIGLEGIVRLRNALYGPKVPALDVKALLAQHSELRREAYKLIGLRRVVFAFLALALAGCATGLSVEETVYYNRLGQSAVCGKATGGTVPCGVQPIYLPPPAPAPDPACYAMSEDAIYYRLYCR